MTRVGLNGRLRVTKLKDIKKKCEQSRFSHVGEPSRLEGACRLLVSVCLAQKKNVLNACVRILFFCLYDYIVDLKLKNTVNKPSTAIKVLS